MVSDRDAQVWATGPVPLEPTPIIVSDVMKLFGKGASGNARLVVAVTVRVGILPTPMAMLTT